MTQIAFIRHGPTEWNVNGLIQGRSDVSLSAAGRAEVAAWTLPAGFASFDWHSSPLIRAVETARLLGAPAARTDIRLAEADWGEWEGHNLKQLRAELGEELARNEARGLDLTPPGGESPRQVRVRLRDWLREVGPIARPVVAVTHNGVLRAAYSLATGWDMKSQPDLSRRHGVAHLYHMDAQGYLTVKTLNINMEPERA